MKIYTYGVTDNSERLTPTTSTPYPTSTPPPKKKEKKHTHTSPPPPHSLPLHIVQAVRAPCSQRPPPSVAPHCCRNRNEKFLRIYTKLSLQSALGSANRKTQPAPLIENSSIESNDIKEKLLQKILRDHVFKCMLFGEKINGYKISEESKSAKNL